VIDALGLAVRWATFAAILTIVGAVVFRFAILARTNLAGHRVAEAAARATTVGALAAALLIPVAIARLAVQTSAMRFPGDPWLSVGSTLATQTSWGHVWLMQFGAAVLLVAAFLAARRGGRVWWAVVVVLAAILAATPTLASHAMSAERLTGVSIAADLLHVVAASAWMGTLAVMFDSTRRFDLRDGAYTTALLDVFSPLARWAALAVVASGTLSAVAHITSVSALTGSSYGLMLVRKLIVVAIVAAIGWRNWRTLTPKIPTTGPGPMRRAMAIELAMAMIVLGLTAALVNTPPR
jgi:putative copper export protein